MDIIGIIPLGGNATRMKNLPKFLLPCKQDTTLLDNTINIFHSNNIINIIAGVSSMNKIILDGNENFKKITVESKTMTETVSKIITTINKISYKNILIMPDTYFVISNEISKMIDMLNNNYDIVVIVWKIKDYQIGKVGQCKIENDNIIDVIDKDKNCEYEYFWGIIGWNAIMNKYINPSSETIGDLIKKSIEVGIKVGSIICYSNYYDCGTFSEYFKMIKNET